MTFLTIFPVSRGLDRRPQDISNSRAFYPAVGLLIGLLLVESAHFRCSAAEISRIANGAPVPELCQEVLAELAERALPKTSPGRADP